MHVLHVSTGEVHGSDPTGLLASAAAVVLLGLGAAIPFRRRGEGRRGRRRTWITRGAVTVAAAVGAQLVLMPVAVGLVQTHMYRKQVHERSSPAYRDVTFTSTDGLTLSGWYRPSRNGAAVVVLPGAGGIRNGTLRHARLLTSHGYGVLVYDARGTGRSEGTPNG